MKRNQGRISFSLTEIKQLLIASIVIAFAFAIILFRENLFLALTQKQFTLILLYISLSLIIVGLAFIMHELGHKFVAQKKGLWAEFRYWPLGLLIAIGSSFLGFVFAAPGAVMISQRGALHPGFAHVSKKDMGQIGAAGPAVNIILAVVFGVLAIFVPFVVAQINVWLIAAQVNTWLAIFNLIPFGMLDGRKIWTWSPYVWGGLMGTAALLFIAIPFVAGL